MAAAIGFGMPFMANMGMQKYGNVILPNLNVFGMVELDGTTVQGPTAVNGVINAINATFLGSLNVMGSAKLNACSVQDIEINTTDSSFKDSSIKNMLVKQPSDGREQKIVLIGATHLSGSIIFERPNGRVIKDASCKIDGEVRGAIVTTL